MEKLVNICTRLKQWMRQVYWTLFLGSETQLSLLEMLIGRKYYLVVLGTDDKGLDSRYLCSTLFLFRREAERYAAKVSASSYVISTRRRTAYNRVIAKGGLRLTTKREYLRTGKRVQL